MKKLTPRFLHRLRLKTYQSDRFDLFGRNLRFSDPFAPTCSKRVVLVSAAIARDGATKSRREALPDCSRQCGAKIGLGHERGQDHGSVWRDSQVCSVFFAFIACSDVALIAVTGRRRQLIQRSTAALRAAPETANSRRKNSSPSKRCCGPRFSAIL